MRIKYRQDNNLRAPGRLFALVIFGVGLISAAGPDSVYTHKIALPDVVGKYFVPLVPTYADSILNLLYWRYGEQAPSDTAARTSEDSTTTDEAGDAEPKLDLTIDQWDFASRYGAAFLPAKLRGRKTGAEINSTTGSITLFDEYDGLDLRLPSTAALDWYISAMLDNRLQQMKRYNLTRSLQPKVGVTQIKRGRGIEILGGNIAGQRVSLSVTGNVVLSGGLKFKEQSMQQTAIQQKRNWELDINQTQRFDIEGNIGDRVSVKVHQDSESDFEWENDMKIAYRGEEDEILKSVDAGNISLSLPGTRYATGSGGSSQGLFGIKAVTQFGPLSVTTIASVEKSKKAMKSNELSEALVVRDMDYIRGRYFFIDAEFRSNFYPLEPDGYHLADAFHIIADLVVYRSISGQAADTYAGQAYIDPSDPAAFANDMEQAHFKRLILNQDYSTSLEMGWIRLTQQADQNDIIAVAYSTGILTVDDTVFVTRRVGDIDRAIGDSTDLTLKLIKGRGQTPNSPTWPLEFKNVYSLGGMRIIEEGFEVRIIDSQGTTGEDDRTAKGTSFLQIFGLDQQDMNQDPIPDEIVDFRNSNIVKLSLGELHFPALLPFAYLDTSDSGPIGIGGATHHPELFEIYPDKLEDLDQDFRLDTFIGGVEADSSLAGVRLEADGDRLNEIDLNDDGKLTGPAIYYSSNRAEKNSESRFTIEVKQSSRGSSEYQLGFNMVPGSETVRVNGNVLTPGVDYKLDEFTGKLTILDMSAYADPEVIIEYEENLLFSFDKKVMLGTRAEIELGENSFLGATALYYNQSIVEERIDVGSEPIQNVLWDVNGRFKREIPLFTRLVDRLPFIQTDASSSIEFEGEIAQVRPNPNPLGVGYVDDFESAKRVTSPSLRFNAWYPSAAPVDVEQYNRRKMSWWNPDLDYSVASIWPQMETSTQANNLTTTVLVLDALFDNSTGGLEEDSLWAGITYPLYASEYDQTRTKFLEIWLKGFYGNVNIDLGIISEDINGNGVVDTEDNPVAGFDEGNGIVDIGEDIGLDHCADEYEDGLGGCLDNPRPDQGVNDPNGDNYVYERGLDRMDKVNGTEGNQNGIAQGAYPDTEDLNGNGTSWVDDQNDYFSFKFNLDENHPDTSFIGGRTAYNNEVPTGWRLYRLPLNDFIINPGMTPAWDKIKHMRIWIDGMDLPQGPYPDINGRIKIAKIEFVGNEWEEIGQAPVGTEDYIVGDNIGLAATVANTEDNDDYISPVKREYDRLNNIELREQSLVLDFERDGIAPGFKAALRKTVAKQDGTFLIYGTMEMFVHGDIENAVITRDTSPVLFWFRMGHGTGADYKYYEIRKKLYPDWDERNKIRFRIDELAQLKLREEADTLLTIVSGENVESIPGYVLDDMMVYVRGDPSLERIKEYTVGVINGHDQPIFGKVMLDDLRLLDVQKDNGIALRVSAKIKLADLMNASFGYERKDADFHQLQQKALPNTKTSETFMASATLQAHKLVPQKWGLKIPVSVSYNRSLSSPKYHPGRDILAGGYQTAPDSIQSLSNSMALKTSFAKTSRSRNWWVRQSLDRLIVSLNYTHKTSSNITILSNLNTSLATTFGYPVKFSEENYWMPFAKLEKIPLLGKKLKDMRLYYTPTNLDFAGNLVENVTERVVRAFSDSTAVTYTLNLKRSIKSTYRITDKITSSYAWNASSTLDHLRNDKLNSLKNLDTGIDVNYTETLATSYKTDIFTWLRPTFSYQSRYSWVKNPPIVNPERGGRISSSGRLAANVDLELKKIIETVYTPEGTTGQSSRRSRRGRSSKTEETKKKKEIKNPQLKALLKALHKGSSMVLPIVLTYSYNRDVAEPNAIGQPGLDYRLALVESSGLRTDDSTTAGIDLSTIREDISVGLRSGITPIRNINITLSYAEAWRSTAGRGNTNNSNTVSFLMLNTDDKVGIPFVNWGLRWSGLEKLPILKLLPWKVTLDHKFSGDRTTAQQGATAETQRYKRAFSPLVGLTMTFKNGISTNARISANQALARAELGDELTNQTQISASFSYMKRGGLKLKLPFFKDVDLQNTINFSLDFVYSDNVSESRRGTAREFTVMREHSSWSIKPYITYTFSNRLTGTARFSYTEIDDLHTGNRIERDFGFDVNIAIRGK